MAFENIENLFALFCTVIGLICAIFVYFKIPKKSIRYIVIFFLSHFLSDYYWTIYVLVMGDYPEVSEYVAYLGWNISYLFLFLAVLLNRRDGEEVHLHPLMFWPVLTNVPLFFYYIQFGGLFNNVWQVGITTAIMVISSSDVIYYLHRRKKGAAVPVFQILVLAFEIMEYTMWTASCFEWKSELQNPYLYASIIAYALAVLFPWGAGKAFSLEMSKKKTESDSDIRFQTAMQTILSVVIFVVCIAGYLIAAGIRDSMPEVIEGSGSYLEIVIVLFVISAVLVLVIGYILYRITPGHRKGLENIKPVAQENRGRFNLIFTISFTLVLMVISVVYNTANYYDVSVTEVYETGDDKAKMTAADLANYITVAETTLRITADTVELMKKEGAENPKIVQYLMDQTTIQSEQFDENFTGLYAYVGGEYMDGLGWEPPAGYDPVSRDWYKTAVEAGGRVVIVSPYVDAQTGSVVITIAKMLNTEHAGEAEVVCLDVIVNHIREVTEQVDVTGFGYGMVVNSDGFIVAHHDSELDGSNVVDVYGKEILDNIVTPGSKRFDAEDDGEISTFFVYPIMDQWFDVVVVSNVELFDNVSSNVFANVIVSLITFFLITFFYYIGYKNEQVYGKKVEEMNLQVVSALAAAIDAKDNYTNGHSSRVATYSRMIAERLGYSQQKQDEIYMMGLLHDVGKIGVPDEVINKPGRLTTEEFELIKKHPVIGSKILESIKERPMLAIGAKWHHERYTGGGYPDGLIGNEIPKEARIIAVADAYDAMTSRRSYRDIMPQAKVREEIEKGMGTQFDPQFAQIMLELIDEDVNYTMHET